MSTEPHAERADHVRKAVRESAPTPLFDALDGLVEALSDEAGLTMNQRLADQYSDAQQVLYAEHRRALSAAASQDAPEQTDAGVEATVYENGAMKTRPITVDHVMEGSTAYGRIWIDHHLSIELSKRNVARLIDALSELDL